MKSIVKCFFTLLMPALLTGGIFAQQPIPKPTPPPSPCPSVSVSCPDMVAGGEPLTFSADVRGGDPNVTPTFNWMVSAGTIQSGQGTSSITVDTTGTDGQTITATVELGGYPRECRASNSCTASVSKKVLPSKFDEFNKLKKAADVNARLDNFGIALQSDPTAIGYIITYGGRKSSPDEAQKMADAAGDYLYKVRKAANGQVLVGVGGYREEPTYELWLAPEGAAPPMATPTVDPSEVTPPKPKPTPKPKTPVKPKPKTTKKS